ncbi:MAG: tRNA (adenosine(37)-N6)-threonylcarbamoyltransferase complex dimerization subunit type 1 TsaB [Bdellovibrionales bacterium]
MIVLGLDSAGQGCGVCVWRDGIIVSVRYEPMARGQDRRLIPMAMEAISAAGITFAQINRIAVTRGPGSFTGLRVGLAAAQGFGLAHHIPVLGFDRFDLLAKQASQTTHDLHAGLLIALASQRQELFCRFDPSPSARGAPTLKTRDEIHAVIENHPGLWVTGDANIPGQNIPLECEAATCAALAAEADPNDPALTPTPLYLRRPDVSLSPTALTLEPLGTASQTPLPDQAQTLAALHAASFEHAAWSASQFEQTLALATTRGQLVRQNGVPAGFILLQIMKPEAEILTFCVAPNLREHGLGRQLLAESLREAGNSDCETVFLEVASDNLPACRLYERHGFELMGNRKNYYKTATGHVDALTYKKPINHA